MTFLIQADSPKAREVALKDVYYSTGTYPVRGVVDKIDENSVTVVEVFKDGEVKEHTLVPINLLKAGKILPEVSPQSAYRWEDLQRGDVVELGARVDKAEGTIYCLKVSIRRRPKGPLPASQNPKEDVDYPAFRVFNELENGRDVSDEDIKAAFPPLPAGKYPDGKVFPARPGGLPDEYQKKLDAIRAKKAKDGEKKPDLKAPPPPPDKK